MCESQCQDVSARATAAVASAANSLLRWLAGGLRQVWSLASDMPSALLCRPEQSEVLALDPNGVLNAQVDLLPAVAAISPWDKLRDPRERMKLEMSICTPHQGLIMSRCLATHGSDAKDDPICGA
eukprot:64933-Amphidinium_carterae.1